LTDTGHGIDADLLPHVFDRFRQGHRTTVHGHGGLGLGLTLVRELVELHGGIVHAESAGKDQGATFTVELPVMSLPSQAAYAAGAWAGRHPEVEPDTRLLEGLRILVVDDHPDTLEVLKSSLEASGAHVIAAESGAPALDAYVNSPAAIDAVVSDISMPGDGRLRADSPGPSSRAGRVSARRGGDRADRVRP